MRVLPCGCSEDLGAWKLCHMHDPALSPEGILRVENANLRAEVETWRERCESNLGVADSVRERLRLSELENSGMKEMLSQFRDNLHLHQHDAKVPVEDCPEPPCQKVMKYTEKRICEHIYKDHQCEKCGAGQVCGRCGNIKRKPHDEATCDYGNV